MPDRFCRKGVLVKHIQTIEVLLELALTVCPTYLPSLREALLLANKEAGRQMRLAREAEREELAALVEDD
jgi:hypothetical protein